MKNLTIRKATPKDIEAMVRIRRTAFTDEEVQGFTPLEHSFFYSVSRLKKEWKEDNRLKNDWEIYVAEDNQSPHRVHSLQDRKRRGLHRQHKRSQRAAGKRSRQSAGYLRRRNRQIPRNTLDAHRHYRERRRQTLEIL